MNLKEEFIEKVDLNNLYAPRVIEIAEELGYPELIGAGYSATSTRATDMKVVKTRKQIGEKVKLPDHEKWSRHGRSSLSSYDLRTNKVKTKVSPDHPLGVIEEEGEYLEVAAIDEYSLSWAIFRKRSKIMKKVYVNKNTGKEVTIKTIENVKSYPENIAVFILSDDTRWEQTLFYDNHNLKDA